MQMNKTNTNVIPIRKSDLVGTLELMLDMARNGEVNNFVAAGFLADGSVFTAVIDADAIEHHTLVSYLQTNAIIRTVRENGLGSELQ